METKAELIKASPLRFVLILPAKLLDRTDVGDIARKWVDRTAAALLVAVGKSIETEKPSFLALSLDFKYAFVVFDLLFHNCCWETAHDLAKNRLAVHKIRGLTVDRLTVKRNMGLENLVNADIARLHKCNGDNRPPYVEDCSPGADPIVSRNLRKL